MVKKTFFLFLSLLYLSLTPNASEPVKTILEGNEKERFRKIIKEAKVKKIKAVKYEIVDRKESGKKFLIIEQSFDQNGNLTEVKTFDKEIVNRTINFSYDENNNLVKKEEYSSDEKLQKKITYHYENSRIKKIEIYNGNGKLLESREYLYNSDNKKITLKIFKEGKYLEYFIEFIYKEDFDKNGNNLSYKYSAEGKLLSITESQCGIDGRVYEKIEFNPKEEIQSVLRFSYDEKGNIIKLTSFDKDKNIQYYDEFKYDQKNLCTEIKRFFTPERILTKIVNEYEYY